LPLAWVFATPLSFRASNSGVQLLVPLAAREIYHLSDASVGIALSAAGLAAMLANLAFARFAGTSGARSTLAWSGVALAAMALGPLVLATSSMEASFFAGAVLYGAGVGVMTPALLTVAGSSKLSRNPMAIYGAALSLGLVLGPGVVSVALANSGQDVHWGLAWATALLAPALAGLIVWRRKGSPQEPGGKAPSSPRLASSERRWLGVAVWCQVLYEVPFVAATTFGPLVGKYEDGLRASAVAAVFFAMYLASFVIRVLLVWADLVRRASTLLVAAGLTSVGGVTLLPEPGWAAFLAGALLLSVGHAITYPLSLTLVRNHVDPSRLGRANGLLSAWVGAVGVGVPAALGAVVASAGYRLGFAILAGPVLVTLAGALVGLRAASRV
jgi:MFS family permease